MEIGVLSEKYKHVGEDKHKHCQYTKRLYSFIPANGKKCCKVYNIKHKNDVKEDTQNAPHPELHERN